jgi:flagellar capping protein FliD
MIVAVMVRETWTDERLDDLNKKVDHGFTKVDARFDRLEARMDAQFGQMNERFDRMQQTLIGSAVVLVAALLGILATQL